jgi:hypothetical protein
VAADSSSEVEVPKEAVETPPTGSDTLFEVREHLNPLPLLPLYSNFHTLSIGYLLLCIACVSLHCLTFFFPQKVVGMVDGLSEELHCPGNDPSQWLHMRNVVVEVSNKKSNYYSVCWTT